MFGLSQSLVFDFVVALSLTSLFAAGSWWWVKKPTLRFKNCLRRRPSSALVQHAQGTVPVTPGPTSNPSAG